MKRAGIWIPFPIRDVRLTEASHADAIAEAELKRRIAFVNRMDLFQSLTDEGKAQIAECLERTLFAADENIIRQGQSGDSMFFISHGEVSVIVEKNGVMEKVARMSSGEYFGEMSLLTGERRTATVRAATDVRAYVLRKESFGRVLQEIPDIAEAISRTVADRKAELETKTAKMIVTPRQKEVLRQTLLGRIQRFFGI
jgi:CRP-like cAMP-binding protein